MRINTREELEKSRRDYQKSLVCQKKQILICAGTGCVAGGSLQIYERMQQLMEEIFRKQFLQSRYMSSLKDTEMQQSAQ